MEIFTLYRMTSNDVAAMSVVIQTHTIKPVDPWSAQVKVRRVTRHKSFNSRNLVKPPVHFISSLAYSLSLSSIKSDKLKFIVQRRCHFDVGDADPIHGFHFTCLPAKHWRYQSIHQLWSCRDWLGCIQRRFQVSFFKQMNGQVNRLNGQVVMSRQYCNRLKFKFNPTINAPETTEMMRRAESSLRWFVLLIPEKIRVK